VVGAGGHGLEVKGYIEDLLCAGWRGELVGFLDDTKRRGQYRGMEIIASLQEFAVQDDSLLRGIEYFTAIGNNSGRREVVDRIERLFGGQLRPWTLVHPMAMVGRSEIGEGSLLASGSIVTSGTRVGRHCILNVKASVSHDCEVGDFVSLNPGVTICGHCQIGDSAYIGAGATVIDRVRIGERTIIGAGAVVVRDIPPDATAVGVPARVIKTRREIC